LNIKEWTVAVETLEQVVETVIEKIVEKRHGVQCPRCDSRYLTRTSREGFLEGKVYSMFGYFPWHCKGCGGSFLIKKRGQPARHHHHSPETA
jgi:DNA-directed RNA polymerase subunit RPC12/RpoP